MERYGQTNARQLFHLKKELWEFQQNNLIVSEYYCKLKELWDQINQLKERLECTCAAMSTYTCEMYKKMMKIQSNNKILKFIIGLNGGYEHMEGNILGMDPLLVVNNAYNLVLQVEKKKTNHRRDKFEKWNECLECEQVSATLGTSGTISEEILLQENGNEKEGKRCDYCGLKNHVKERCWKLNGYPNIKEP